MLPGVAKCVAGAIGKGVSVLERGIAIEGPFSWDLMRAHVRWRPNEIVDVVEDGRYRRLLEHDGRLLLLGVDAPVPELLAVTLEGLNAAPLPEDLDRAVLAAARMFSLDIS